jgi:hypothetical protein
VSDRDDPRPWWFKVFERDLYRRLDRQDAHVGRRFDELDHKVDHLEGEGYRQLGVTSQKKSAFSGGITILAIAIAASGVLVAIVTALTQ